MNFLIKAILLFTCITLLITGCAKIPDSVTSASVKINPEKKGTAKTYVLYFSCGLKNENDSVAFMNVSGAADIKDDSGNLVLSVPFKISDILPFETGIIQERMELDSDQADKILNTLSIDKVKLESNEDNGSRFIDEKKVSLKGLKLDKVDIIDLLRNKIKQ